MAHAMFGAFGGAAKSLVSPRAQGMPPAAPPPPPPTIDDAAQAGQDAADALRRRRGMASTILAGSKSQSSTQPATQAAQLLGS